MKLIHLIFAVLSTFRLVELFLMDRITAKLRARFPSYLWTCSRCLSVWAGAFATLAFIFLPWLNWPFAMSWILFTYNDWIVAHRTARQGRQLHIDLKDGVWILKRNELQPQETADILSQIIRPSPQANGQAGVNISH